MEPDNEQFCAFLSISVYHGFNSLTRQWLSGKDILLSFLPVSSDSNGNALYLAMVWEEERKGEGGTFSIARGEKYTPDIAFHR